VESGHIHGRHLTAIAELKRERDPLALNGKCEKAPILQVSLHFAAERIVV